MAKNHTDIGTEQREHNSAERTKNSYGNINNIKSGKEPSPRRTFKKMLSNVANFVIYDKSDDYIIDNDYNDYNDNKNNLEEDYSSFDDYGEYNEHGEYDNNTLDSGAPNYRFKFTKTPVNSINSEIPVSSDSINSNVNDNGDNLNNLDNLDNPDNTGREFEEFVETFDSLKQEQEKKKEKTYHKYKKHRKYRKKTNDSCDSNDLDESYDYGDYADYNNHEDTKTAIPNILTSAANSSSASHTSNTSSDRKIKSINKINLSNTVKRFLILVFSVICGSITMPFGMNPLGISILCAADKYTFYIYAGLLISLAFCKDNAIVFFGLYTIITGVKFYLRHDKEKARAKMLSASPSYKNLTGREKIKLMRLVHFNDTGSVIMSVLVCAISGSVVGFIHLALKIESLVYTDLIIVMLFVLISMLFTYLYCGLFDIGTDNKTLEKAGVCSVIFTAVYFLAPYYIYNLSIGYIFSFILTLIAANSGFNKIPDNLNNLNKSSKSDRLNIFNKLDKSDKSTEENENGDEEIISRFALNLINHDGILSDITRGALVGLLCGLALGDTAGAVTLAICGLVSGLFFSQSAVLAIISGLVSAVSYSVYIAGIDAVQRYIPNIVIGLSVYLPASILYSSFIRKAASSISNKDTIQGEKSIPQADRGLLITELPANKLNNLSDAFQNLSGIFYEFANRMKNPTLNEVKAIVSAAVEKSCGSCENYTECELRGRAHLSGMHKKASEYVHNNKRIDTAGITKIYLENCVRISDIKDYINSVYCRRTEENIANDRTRIFASNFDSIAKLLQNNVQAGKEDISFKKDMSEKIFAYLENMGIECENVIVIGERKRTVYIFGIKMVNYSGTIADITDMLEKVCGTYFGDPEYIIRENYVIMKNQSRNRFKVYSVFMSRAASEVKAIYENYGNYNNTENSEINAVSNTNNTNIKINIENDTDIAGTGLKKGVNGVNGDSVSVFEGNDGYQYGLISDGMGSGKNAALSSRLTALLMEKLLSVGNQKDLTLEMLNSLLISKSDECFASVDLFEADLITGKASFIKAGAAPSFIVRNGKLFKIQSSTVPAGIIGNINSEQTKFDIEEGDYILMLSDGIISTFEEGAWLLEMLSSEKNLRDPKTLLSDILNEAAIKNNRKDDMSVLFLKIAEEKKMIG